MPDIKDGSDFQDTRNVPAEPASTGDKAHVDAALTAADKGLNPNHQQASLLAGKFKNREELLKGIANVAGAAYKDEASLVTLYKSLETNLGKKDTPPAGTEPSSTDKKSSEPSQGSAGEPAKTEATPPKTDDQTPKEEEVSTVDFNNLADEFAKNGKLSDESYKALEDSGFGRDMVDTYLNGVRFNALQMYDRVGGEGKYREMLNWAVANIPEAEQKAFDASITGPAEQRNLAIDGLWQRYVKANGNPPNTRLTPGSNDSLSSVRGFSSQQELTKAMSDPRYGKDPAYEREILARLKVSPVFRTSNR